jgi:hypothetical protein
MAALTRLIDLALAQRQAPHPALRSASPEQRP